MYGPGRCINCGFLSKRRVDKPIREFHEATGVDRANGSLWTVENPFDAMPWCFMRVGQFVRETEPYIADKEKDRSKPVPMAEWERAMRQIIGADRNCQSFYPWQEGLLPQEHYEELRMQQLEDSRRKFEGTMEQRRREFEEKMENDRRYWDEKTETSRRKFEFVLFLIVLIFAGLEVTAGVLGLTNESWIIRQLGLD